MGEPEFVYQARSTEDARAPPHPSLLTDYDPMRVHITQLILIAVAATAACRDDQPEIAAPATPAVSPSAKELESDGPLVRITAPVDNDVVAGGQGQLNTGSLTEGSGFTIIVQTVTKNATDVSANESVNIRNTALLGQPNPNFPGFSVSIDADMITPDGNIIPKNTNLANLFNTLGTDDSPGDWVTIWAGWHVLESFTDEV